MSKLAINDLSESAVLDRAAMAGITGGMDVHIDKYSSAVESTDCQSGVAGAYIRTLAM
jgi:hypothetical protein